MAAETKFCTVRPRDWDRLDRANSPEYVCQFVLVTKLEAVLKAHGAHHYAIWLDAQRHLLFATVEIESEARWNAVAQTEVCQRWWKHMREIMPSNPDNSPVSQELKNVFYLE